MYGQNYNRRRSPQMVTLEVAQQLKDERDAYARELERARRHVAKLESMLGLAEEAELQADELQNALTETQRELQVATSRLEELEVEQAEPTVFEQQFHQIQADLANLRRRRDLDVEQAQTQETMRWLQHLGEVRDNVARAMRVNTDPNDPWYQGLLSILNQVDDVLFKEGVTLVGKAGERFDPHKHEAIGVVDGPVPGIISSVEREGFVLPDGKVGRSALVIVTKG